MIIEVDHPSLGERIETFLAALGTERRHFGPSASRNPKPSRSLIASFRERGGFRLAAVDDDNKIIGMVRVDGSGAVALAVLPHCRGNGTGKQLGRAALTKAIGLGYRRLVIHTTRRSTATRRVGEALGCVVVEGSFGRTDLIIDLAKRQSQSVS